MAKVPFIERYVCHDLKALHKMSTAKRGGRWPGRASQTVQRYGNAPNTASDILLQLIMVVLALAKRERFHEVLVF